LSESGEKQEIKTLKNTVFTEIFKLLQMTIKKQKKEKI